MEEQNTYNIHLYISDSSESRQEPTYLQEFAKLFNFKFFPEKQVFKYIFFYINFYNFLSIFSLRANNIPIHIWLDFHNLNYVGVCYFEEVENKHKKML